MFLSFPFSPSWISMITIICFKLKFTVLGVPIINNRKHRILDEMKHERVHNGASKLWHVHTFSSSEYIMYQLLLK